MSKSRLVTLRAKRSLILSGAAMLTFDQHMDVRTLAKVTNGPAIDQAAIRADSRRAMKGLGLGQGRKRELAAV